MDMIGEMKLKKIIYYFFNSKIGNRLIIYFFLVILLPTITITTFGNFIYKNSIIEEQNSNTKQMTTQISNNVDFHIKDTENIIDYLSKDSRVLKFLNNNIINTSPTYDNTENDAYNAILTYSDLHPEIAGIMIVNESDMCVSNVMERISRDPLTNEKWYLQASRNPTKIQLFSKPIGRNVTNIFQYSAEDVVAVSKAVIDDKSGKCVGVILIDVKLDSIKSIIKNVKPAKAGFIYIVDSNGEIVYSPVNNVVYRIKPEWFDYISNKIMVKRINDKDYELNYDTSNYTSWKTVGVFPVAESLKGIANIKYYSIGVAIVTLIFAGILAIFFTRSIVKPITKLKMLMKETEKGNLDIYFDNKYNDEIGELGNAFNNMISEIKKLMTLIKIQERSKRKAEIEILQAQIKPHFLYNTLDTIQWMAQEHGAYDIIKIVQALTDLFRIILSNGDELIIIKEEIKHVESYLIIQKMRYEDKIQYKISIDESILKCRVIKLTLQPLVENAIYHGVKEKEGKGEIFIYGEMVNNKIHFVVKDNGVGMKVEELNKLNSSLKSDSGRKDSNGYGIFNVNELIRLNYGESFGLSYESVYGEGTTVHIWYPVIS